MVGHKYNLKELIIDLKADRTTYTTTEFCQGRVTRWGLAWTYQNYDFSKLFSPKDTAQKKNTPISFTLPVFNESSGYVEKLKEIFNKLQITHKKITKRNNELILDFVAFSNTWSNQRRKRRMQQRLTEEKVKKAKANPDVKSNEISEASQNDQSGEFKESEKLVSERLYNKQHSTVKKRTENAEVSTNSHGLPNNTHENSTEPIVHAIMKIAIKDKILNIEMEFLNGIAGKEGLHQIVQYIKNNWK